MILIDHCTKKSSVSNIRLFRLYIRLLKNKYDLYSAHFRKWI